MPKSSQADQEGVTLSDETYILFDVFIPKITRNIISQVSLILNDSETNLLINYQKKVNFFLSRAENFLALPHTIHI